MPIILNQDFIALPCSAPCVANEANESSEDELQEEELRGSDDDEQEDPADYCKGTKVVQQNVKSTKL